MLSEGDWKPSKKPVPLPRKSLLKQNKIPLLKEIYNEEEDQTFPREKEEKNFVRDDWKSASESFVLEKKRLMKNEVNKFEKSVKSIISRRKSSNLKSQNETLKCEPDKSDSLPDGSIFFSISFNSPLVEGNNPKTVDNNNLEDNNFYEDTMSSPPDYPPPDPPDELIYDQMKNIDFSNVNSCEYVYNQYPYAQNNSSSSTSFGSDYMTPCELSLKKDFSLSEVSLSDDIKNRYEIIGKSAINNFSDNSYMCSKEVPKVLDSEMNSSNTEVDVSTKYHNPQIKYIIHLFDPLQENNKSDSEFNADSKTSEVDFKIQKCKSYPFKSEKNKNSYEAQENDNCEDISSSCANLKIIPPNLKEGHYGKIKKPITSLVSATQKILPVASAKEPPPIPPRTFPPRPLPEFVQIKKDITEETNLTSSIPDKSEEKHKLSDGVQWASLKRVAKKVADNIENRTSYLSLGGRKSNKVFQDEHFNTSISNSKSFCGIGVTCSLPQNFSKHSGIMYRPGGVERWGVLSQRKLTLFANKDSPDVKETVPMDNVLSIQATQNKISSNETTGIHCFEISIPSRNQMLLFGVPSISERHIWMRKLLESIGPGFSTKLSMDYTKAGWCFAKESITCDWTKYCILLHHRTLYLTSENVPTIAADLRKARKITLQVEGFNCEQVTEKGPIILVDLQDKTLYLQMDYERETKAWELAITAAALKNGPSLSDQQLTKDDVPAVVDKCLNFVHTHGSFSEGIYRRNGSNRTVSQLLASFRCNAWSIQLSREDYTEFDVSSVLKRFFRDLPEPLIVPEIQEELGNILGISDVKDKIEFYKSVLKKLPSINYLTARRLLCHLHFINKLKEKNLMGSENLAAIWGPTILQVQEQVSLGSDCFKMETLIVNDLICLYPEIFDVDQTEVEKEMKILKMLESYHTNSNGLNKKPSGELKIWVYLHSAKNVDNCVNISINPQKTAEEVCKELSSKMNSPYHCLCLEEVICSGHLSRPLNHSEKVLDTVLRWSYWDEADRKDNCLVLTKNDLFQQVVKFSKFPIIVSEELKFADQKTKTFKSYQFEFSQAKLICYKDKLCSQKVGEWKVEDIVWYFGHEPKRVPHAKWSLTFIEKHSIAPRTKEKLYFGNTICGSSEEQKLKLITAMLLAQYSKDILPSPILIE